MLSDSDNAELQWLPISSEKIADCQIFQVRRERKRHEHREHDFFVLTGPSWVNIIPVTPDGDVVLIEQFRHGTEKITLEIPGGMIDEGESALACGRREMNEETGYDTGKIFPLGVVEPNPAFLRNTCSMFLALDVHRTKETSFDEHEDIRVRLVPLSEIPSLIKGGAIKHSLVIAAFHALHLHRDLLPEHFVY